MAETIKAFVEKLQTDGVEAGRRAADQIQAEARQRAQSVIHEAEAQARKILEEANRQIERNRAGAQMQLQLAARDTLIRLQETLSRALETVLEAAAQETLADPDFLRELLRDVVTQYARADADGANSITINVPDAIRGQLLPWALQAFQEDGNRGGPVVDLQGSLAKAGFEYRVGEGTIEVTVDSAVELLGKLVGPELRQVLDRAAAGDPAATEAP